MTLLIVGTFDCYAQSPTVATCVIEARILTIYKPDVHSVAPYNKRPSVARIALLEVNERSSGFSLSLAGGDTVDAYFSCTLSPTAKQFRGRKSRLPGLKKGSRFVATAIQKLQPGTGGILQIDTYHRK